MVTRHCLAALSLTLLAPSLAWAAPPSDPPPVQKPSQPVSGETETAAPAEAPAEAPEAPSVSEPAPEASEIAPTEPAGTEDPSSADTPTDAGTTGPDSATAESGALPEHDEPLSGLLVSDEPEGATPRVRVAPDRDRVDRSERMRNYYAEAYRPADNPSRIYFAARGAFALSGTSEGTGGGRMGFANAEVGQTWNYIGYGVGASLFAGGLTFGDTGVEQFAPLLVGGGPSLGLGRLGLFGRGYLDLRVGYNFFYAPVSTTRAELSDPPDAAPHGPKVQVDVGLLFHDSEQRRFRHGLGATIGWQMLVHSLAGPYPRLNTFTVGFSYFFG